MKIVQVHAREIFDSRGVPTVECTMILDDRYVVNASVPSGISRGTHEAVEVRDGGTRLMGLGVRKTVENIKKIIAPRIVGFEPDIIEIDTVLLALDGSDDKSHLGANALLAVSEATCKAQAYCQKKTLYHYIADLIGSSISMPCPMFNLFGGGLHAHNRIAIQEFLIIPDKSLSFTEMIEIGAVLFNKARCFLQEKGKIAAVGYEGEFICLFEDEREVFDCIMKIIEYTGLTSKVGLGIDVAATHLYNSSTGLYDVGKDVMTAAQLCEWYIELINTYPIEYIEDGFSEDSWDDWKHLRAALHNKHVKVVGDDCFTTNPKRIAFGLQNKIADGAIIKPNQIGTISEVLQAIALCKKGGWCTIVSHRSGETNDSFIADLAVGVGASFIKVGGFAHGERMAKYNRLLAIASELS